MLGIFQQRAGLLIFVFKYAGCFGQFADFVFTVEIGQYIYLLTVCQLIKHRSNGADRAEDPAHSKNSEGEGENDGDNRVYFTVKPCPDSGILRIAVNQIGAGIYPVGKLAAEIQKLVGRAGHDHINQKHIALGYLGQP